MGPHRRVALRRALRTWSEGRPVRAIQRSLHGRAAHCARHRTGAAGVLRTGSRCPWTDGHHVFLLCGKHTARSIRPWPCHQPRLRNKTLPLRNRCLGDGTAACFPARTTCEIEPMRQSRAPDLEQDRSLAVPGWTDTTIQAALHHACSHVGTSPQLRLACHASTSVNCLVDPCGIETRLSHTLVTGGTINRGWRSVQSLENRLPRSKKPRRSASAERPAFRRRRW